jgi:hypothetical protein
LFLNTDVSPPIAGGKVKGIWERLNNPDFKPVEFDGFRKRAGLNSFALTPRQWIEKTSAIGLISKPGRYGGTYAHKDTAYEFASWIYRGIQTLTYQRIPAAQR